MKDIKEMNIKSLMGLALRNKGIITALLDRFQPSDIENGLLMVPEAVVNRDLKMLIMEVGDPYVEDYAIQFQNGSIFLDAILNLKQLGRIRARYRMTIEDFHFNNQYRAIRCAYVEDIKSEGNFVQSMAIKAAGLKGSYLQLALEMTKADFIQVHDGKVTIHIDKLPMAEKIPPSLRLIYNGCEDGKLVFDFDI